MPSSCGLLALPAPLQGLTFSPRVCRGPRPSQAPTQTLLPTPHPLQTLGSPAAAQPHSGLLDTQKLGGPGNRPAVPPEVPRNRKRLTLLVQKGEPFSRGSACRKLVIPGLSHPFLCKTV